MSASLVGSEMCIRDRAHTEAAVASLAWPVNLQRRGRWWQWAGTVAARPVSYTHLTLPTICSV
eukprot:2871052-Alexandrium_andersonii.AAC.1